MKALSILMSGHRFEKRSERLEARSENQDPKSKAWHEGFLDPDMHQSFCNCLSEEKGT